MGDQNQIAAAAPTRPGVPWLVRWALLALAGVSLVLAVIGLLLPVVPTVPFVLVAAWAAAKSSPRLAAWLEGHPRLGPLILNWRNGGVVGRGAKWTATVLMAMSATSMLMVFEPSWPAYPVIAVMAIVLVWLWRRPEQAPPHA